MNEQNLHEFDKIPDFAMRPAREKIDGFDPTVYEQLLKGLEVFEPEAVEEDVSETMVEEVDKNTLEREELESKLETGTKVSGETFVKTTESTPMESVVTLADNVLVDHLNLVDMVPCEPVRIHVEEDILVPDVKPDLASILSMDGTLQVTEKGQNVGGDLVLQTLYVPEGKGVDRSVISMESRLRFQHTGRFVETASADETLGMKAAVSLESLEYSVINERKFRVKATVKVEGRNYRNRKLELFEGLRDDTVQMLQEKVLVTDVVQRKTEALEVEEDILLPEGIPEVGKVLRCDVNLVENHKQIGRDKAVISGTVYYNIMYLPLESVGAGNKAESAASGTSNDVVKSQNPYLFQGKTEFTQFVPLGLRGSAFENVGGGSKHAESGTVPKNKGREGSGSIASKPTTMEGPLTGRSFFRTKQVTAEPKDTGDGVHNMIHLAVSGETYLELYRDVERQIVTDAYHHQKDMVFDTETVDLLKVNAGSVGETNVRDVVSIPEGVEAMDRVIFLSGSLAKVSSRIEGGKNVSEGLVKVTLVGISDDEQATPFHIRRELPFRVATDTFLGPEFAAQPDNDVQLKELRFDRLNNRQIELNGSVVVNGMTLTRCQYPLIRSVGFSEKTGPDQDRPGLVLYITRKGDTLWKIARKYRTTIDNVTKINGLDGTAALKPGMKLLIVK